MENRHIQAVLAAAGFYTGGIDGILGPKCDAAMEQAEARYHADYTFDPTSSTSKRRRVAAAQACLNQLGFDAGHIDGWSGVHTNEALNAFLFKTINGKDEKIDRSPINAIQASGDIPHQRDVGRVYGEPGADIRSKLVTIELPFSLRIDWNRNQKTRRITVHKLCAEQLKAALIAVHAYYGAQGMHDLGIDRYAGTYNHRRMRGGSKWSMHAYGCAIDFYAEPNGLRTRCPQALFCGPEYKAFLDIMEEHEWLPAMRLWGADAMHFQRARV